MDWYTLLIIIGGIILLPLTYIQGFLIIELGKKLGYLKFLIIFLFYIGFWGLIVHLLTIGYIGLLVFFVAPIIVQCFGVFLLRKDFRKAVKEDLFGLKLLFKDGNDNDQGVRP